MIKADKNQTEALLHYHNLYENNYKRFYMGFKMGMGKTYTSLIFFKEHNIFPLIIITKSNLLKQWEKSYQEIFQNNNVLLLNEVRSEENWEEKYKTHTLIVSYERFIKMFHTYITLKNYANLPQLNIILDESQILKDNKTLISKTFQNLNPYFNYVMLLSGSIISKNLANLYTQYIILNHTLEHYQALKEKWDPKRKDLSYYSFIKEYFYVGQSRYSHFEIQGVKDEQRLIKDFSYAAYYLDIPFTYVNAHKEQKLINVAYLNHSLATPLKIPYQWKQERVVIKDNQIVLLDTPLNSAIKFRTYLSNFMYAKEIPNEKYLPTLNNFYEDNKSGLITSNLPTLEKDSILYFKNDNDKQSLLLDIINTYQENLVIFYNFRPEKDLISLLLKNKGYEIYTINGENSFKENQIEKAKGLSSKHLKAFLIQYQAGAQGLDGLQVDFFHLVHYSLTYSPELYLQANGRIYRKGQNHSNLFIHHLIVSPIEETILNSLNEGKRFSDLIFSQKIEKLIKKGEI